LITIAFLTSNVSYLTAIVAYMFIQVEILNIYIV